MWRGVIDRSVDLPARCGLLGAALLAILLPGIYAQAIVQWAPWLVAIVFLGLPHGGIDHLVPAMLRSGWRFADTVLFIAGYLLAIGLVIGLWMAAPDAGLILFFLISILHFGQGDLYWSRRFGLLSRDRGLGSLMDSAYPSLLLLVRGMVPVLLPWLVHGEEFRRVTTALGSRLPALRLDGWRTLDGTRAGLLALICLLVVAQMVCSLMMARRRTADQDRYLIAVEAVETALLVGVFCVVPPIPAVGIYFLLWHSARHIRRLMEMAEPMRSYLDAGRYWRALGSLHWKALPMTLAAASLLMLIPVLTRRLGIGAADLLAVAFVFVSAVTFPHFMLVVWMDCRRRSGSDPSGTRTTHHSIPAARWQ